VTDEFGTQLLRTSITSEPDGTVRWTRRPGRSAPNGFSTLGSTPVPGTTPSSGADPRRRDYRVASARSLADELFADEPDPVVVEAALAATGRALRLVHGRRVPDAPSPRSWLRLHHWLTRRPATSMALHAAGHVRDLLGADRWTLATDLTADVVGPRRRTSVIHGAPGIGSVVLGGAPESAATLLIGEDLATGDPVADVGWTTGELVELAGRAGGGPRWRGFVDALHRGYLGENRVWSPEENRRVEQYAGLRILLHLHDFLAYVRYSEAEVRLCTSMASSLLDHAVGDREAIA